MFRSSVPNLSVPSSWTLIEPSPDVFARGRYSDLLGVADTFSDDELWFKVGGGSHAIALIGGLTSRGVKAVSKQPGRLSTFNQHIRVRAWHVEDILSVAAEQFVPVASVAVLPYGWVIKDADPGVLFTSRRHLKGALNRIDADHAYWRPSVAEAWAETLSNATGPVSQHDLVLNDTPHTKPSRPAGSNS